MAKVHQTEPITISSYYGNVTVGTRGKVVDGVLILTRARARSLEYAIGLITGDGLVAHDDTGRRLVIRID